jgi:hypothetical protein
LLQKVWDGNRVRKEAEFWFWVVVWHCTIKMQYLLAKQ